LCTKCNKIFRRLYLENISNLFQIMASKVKCTCGWSWNKSDSSKKDMYVCHQCGKDNSMKDGGWLSKYNNTPEAQNGIEGTMAGLTDVGFNYNGAWGGTMAMGGSLPGSVGFTYARTQGSAPSNGKYTKKTKASAQNGQEMKFYQEGLDWKPKTISQDGGKLSKAQTAKTVKGEYKKFSLPSLLKENFNSKQDNTVVNTNLQQLSSANPLDTIINQRNINIKLTGNSNLPYSHREFVELKSTYNDAERDAEMKYSANKKFINIKDTKYNTRHNQRVNTAILDDIVKAAVKSKIDPYTALAIAQRETGIGYYSDRKINNKATVEEVRPSSIFSNWELMNQGLNREDLRTIGNEVPARVYNKVKKYYDSILQYPFQGEMKTINDKTKKGTFIRGYNYGDPDYPNKVAKEKEILMSDENKVFRNYVDSVATSKFKDGGWLNKYEEGGIIEDDLGQWAHPGEITKINSNQITMQGVDYPVLGVSDTGDTQMMQPGQDYTYDGESVTEYPMMQKGGKIKKFLDQAKTSIITGGGNPFSTASNLVEPSVDLLASTLAPHETVKEREALFNKYRPVEYPNPVNIMRGILYPEEQGSPRRDIEGNYDIGEEAWRKALDLPVKENYIVPSQYKPTDAKNPKAKYYTLKDIIDSNKILAKAKELGWKPGSSYNVGSLAPFIREGAVADQEDFGNVDPLQQFQLDIDPEGNYASIYDVYDFNFPGLNKIIKPYEFYDRFYLPEKKISKGKKENGGWLSKYN